MRAIRTRTAEEVEALVRAHQGALRAFLSFLGCPSALLDDLLQDVFLAVLASGFEDRGPRATASYLRRVAHHLLIKAVRRERRNVALPDAAAAEEAWIEFERDDAGETYLAALRACLTREEGRAREVLTLRYAQSLSRTAIGERLGLAESGVKSILQRARARLKACVERRLAADGPSLGEVRP